MEGWPKHFTVFASSSHGRHFEPMASGWYVAHNGECVYLLERWECDLYDPTLIVGNLAQIEGLNVLETVFFELCTRLMYETKSPDEYWYRRLIVYCEADEGIPFLVSGFTWERCRPAIQEAFAGILHKISAGEDLVVSKRLASLIEFHEIVYANPHARDIDDECCFALYAFVDHGTCLFAKTQAGDRYQWEDSETIVRAIIERERLDPLDVIFHDATPGSGIWARVIASARDDEYSFAVEPDMPHHLHYSELIDTELAQWSSVVSSGDAGEES